MLLEVCTGTKINPNKSGDESGNGGSNDPSASGEDPSGLLNLVKIIELIEATGERALSAGSAGKVVPNALTASEVAQAEQVVALRGGEFVGPTSPIEPGIDGYLNGEPVSLKSVQGDSPLAVLRNAAKAATQAQNAGYTGVELYVDAPNVRASRLVDFGANGGLARIPTEGTISSIYVNTADGWVIFPG